VVPPCDRCRQVLLDHFPGLKVIVGEDERVRTVLITGLLPEAEQGVGEQADQEDAGQARAQQGLLGVGDRGGGAEFAARAALGHDQERHDGQGECGRHAAGCGVPGTPIRAVEEARVPAVKATIASATL